MSSYKKPSNYTSIPVTCSTSREPLKTSKIDRIQQSPWRPATICLFLAYNRLCRYKNNNFRLIKLRIIAFILILLLLYKL